MRDFIPCLNREGEAGLYDAVNDVFYGGKGKCTLEARPYLPSGYQRLEYVETDGVSYFDTKVVARSGTKAETGMMWGALSAGDMGYLCARIGQDGRFLFMHQYGNSWWAGYKNQNYQNWKSITANEYYRVISEVTSDGKFHMDVNGQTWDKDSSSTVGAYSTGVNLYLFAQNGRTANVASCFSASGTRCYYLKIWQVPDGGTDYRLVRDFIPCVRNDGAIGLYDAVSNEFYAKKLDGALRAGPAAFGDSYTWQGGASGNLSDADNWWPTPTCAFTSDDELVIDSAAAITVDYPAVAGRITLNASGTTQFAASGDANSLTVGSIVNAGAGTATLSCQTLFSGAYPYKVLQGDVALASGTTLRNGTATPVIAQGSIIAAGTGVIMDGAFKFMGGTLLFSDVDSAIRDLSTKLAFTNAMEDYLANVGAVTVDFTAMPNRNKVLVCAAGGLTADMAAQKVRVTMCGESIVSNGIVEGGSLILHFAKGFKVILK